MAWDPGTKTYTINSATGSATNFDVQGSTGTTVNITQNDTLSLLAGTGISTVSASGTDSVTISNTGVTQIIAGPGIIVDPPGGTGAVTVQASVGKTHGIYAGRNFTVNGKILENQLGQVNITNQPFIYQPMMWDISPGGVTHNYPVPVDDMTNPRALATAVPGIESQINAAIFTSPYISGWQVELQAMKVTMSGMISTSTLTAVQVSLYKGEQCNIGTITNLTSVVRCEIPAASLTNYRGAHCCYADLSTVPTADLKLNEKESYFIELTYLGTYVWGTLPTFPYVAGRVDLHMT